ncbi:MAG: hypothetical protein ABI112_12625 [Terracoccus sp.]
MSTSRYAVIVGLVLGYVAAFGGFGRFVLVGVFAAVAWGIGLALEGKLDVTSLLGRSSDRR